MNSMLILFHNTRDVATETVAQTLAQIPDVRIEIVEPSRIIVWKDSWPIRVWCAKEPHVLQESGEIAELFATERQDRGIIASSDRRFEVSYEPDPDMNYFNTWLFVIEKLFPLVQGKVFDPTDGTFPYSS